MVPTNNPLLGIHLLEHLIHYLKVLVVKEPDLLVLFILIKGDSKTVSNIKYSSELNYNLHFDQTKGGTINYKSNNILKSN